MALYAGSMSDVFPVPARVSEIFDPARWREVEGFTRAGDSRAAARPGRTN